MMQSKKIAYLIVLAALSGCAAKEEAIPLASVPETPTAVQTDLEDTQSDLQAARLDALKSRMKAMQDGTADQAPVAPAEDIAPADAQKTIENLPDGAADAPEPEPAFNPKPAAKPVVMAHPATPPAATYDVINPDMPATVVPMAEVKAEPKKLEPIILRQPHALKAGTDEVVQVFFANNSSKLSVADRKKIEEAAAKVEAKGGHFLVEGYASPLIKPTPKGELMNLRLSMARAKVVSDVLTDRNVPPEDITIKGLSARNPRGFDLVKRRAIVWLTPIYNNSDNKGSTVLWPQ
jgi:outer membrane protein OmpA-like peptidoglycan-associated protein